MKLLVLFLSCPTLLLAVKFRMRRGHAADLKKDSLFEMEWVHHQNTSGPVHVGSEDDCDSWEGFPQCYIEAPEHTLARKWIPEDATVMEFGSRFGTTTCEIAKKIKNSGKLVTIEPDREVWKVLGDNVRDHNCKAHVLRGAVSSEPLRMLGSGYGGRSSANLRARSPDDEHFVPTFTFDEVENALGLQVDTLLIDCEGCAQHMMDQIGPKIQSQIQTIILEADMPDSGGDCRIDCMNYPTFFKFLSDADFEMVDEFNDCDHKRSGAPPGTWCGSWINHYAFKKRADKHT